MATYMLSKPEHYRMSFDGSDALFRACWRQYRTWLRGSIDAPSCDGDVIAWLDQIAAERVNNSMSRFYIHGQ